MIRYDKLVRDKIPLLIAGQGQQIQTLDMLCNICVATGIEHPDGLHKGVLAGIDRTEDAQQGSFIHSALLSIISTPLSITSIPAGTSSTPSITIPF